MLVMNKACEEFWQQYCNEKQIDASTAYVRAYRFGDTPDELAQLVADGIKTTTSNAQRLFELNGKIVPKVGDYNIIMNKVFEPIALIQIGNVEIKRYDEIDEAFAINEGDGSLENWDAIHERYFKEQLAQHNEPFSKEIPLVCQTFSVLKVNK